MTVDTLKDRLARLRRDRHYKEMSDDFAFTNGSIARFDAEIRAVEREIANTIKQDA